MKRSKIELPPLEELGREVQDLIESTGQGLLISLQQLGEKYQRTPNCIRQYWNAYADYHKLEYDKNTNKIVNYG